MHASDRMVGDAGGGPSRLTATIPFSDIQTRAIEWQVLAETGRRKLACECRSPAYGLDPWPSLRQPAQEGEGITAHPRIAERQQLLDPGPALFD